jgi:hypothetical protein
LTHRVTFLGVRSLAALCAAAPALSDFLILIYLLEPQEGARYSWSSIMPSLFPIIVTATQIVLVADSVPKFDVERTCRAAAVTGLPGRDSASCQRDEQDARSKLEKDWSQYSATQRTQCDGLVTTGGAPSYVELLTCLELAKQEKELPADSKMENPVGRR